MSDYQTPLRLGSPSPLPPTPPSKEGPPTFYMIPPPPSVEPIPSCLDKQCIEGNLSRMSSTKTFYSIAETTPTQPTSPSCGFIPPPATASPILSELSSTQYSQVPSPVGSPRPPSQGPGLSFIPPPTQLRTIPYTTQEYNPLIIPKIGEGNGIHGGPQIPAPAPLQTPTTYPDSNPHNTEISMPKQPRVATSVGLGVEPIRANHKNLPFGFGSGLYGGEQALVPEPLHHITYPHTNPHGPRLGSDEKVSMPSPSDSKRVGEHVREESGLYRGEYIPASEPHHQTYPQRNPHDSVGTFHEDIDDDVTMPALPRMSPHPPAPMGDEQERIFTHLAISSGSGLHESEQIPAPAPLAIHGPTHCRNPYGNVEVAMPSQPRVASLFIPPTGYQDTFLIGEDIPLIEPPHSVCYPHTNPHRNGGNTNIDVPALAHTLSTPAPSKVGHSSALSAGTHNPISQGSSEHGGCQVPAPAPLYTLPVANWRVTDMGVAVPVPAPNSLHITKPTPAATKLTNAALDPQPSRRYLSKLQPGFQPQAPVPNPSNRLSAAHTQLAHLVSGQGPPIDNQLPMVAPSLHIETVNFPEAVGKKPSFWQRRKKTLILFLVVALIAVTIGIVFVAHSFYERWGGQGFLKKRELDGAVGAKVLVVYDTDFYGGKRIRVSRDGEKEGEGNCGRKGEKRSEGEKTTADALTHVSDGDMLAHQPNGEGENEVRGLLEGMIYAGYKRGWGEDEATNAPKFPLAGSHHGSQMINTGEVNHVNNVASPGLDASWLGLGPSWWSSRFESMAQVAKRTVPLKVPAGMALTPADRIHRFMNSVRDMLGPVRILPAKAVKSGEAKIPCPAHPQEGMVQYEVAMKLASDYCTRIPVSAPPVKEPTVWASSEEAGTAENVLPQEYAKSKCHSYVQRIPVNVAEDDSSSADGKSKSWSSTEMCSEDGLTPQEVATRQCQGYTQRVPTEVKDDDSSSASGDPSFWSNSEMGAKDSLTPQDVAVKKRHEYFDRARIEVANGDSSSAAGGFADSEKATKLPNGILGGPYHTHEAIMSESQAKEAAVMTVQGHISSTPEDVGEMGESLDGEAHRDEHDKENAPLLQVHPLYHPEAENEVQEHAKRYAADYATSVPHEVTPGNGNLAWKRMAARNEDRVNQKRDIAKKHSTTTAVKRTIEKPHLYATRFAENEAPREGTIQVLTGDIGREELEPRLLDDELVILEAVRLNGETRQGVVSVDHDYAEMKGKRSVVEGEEGGEVGQKEKRKNPPFAACGDQRHGCEAFGHPEICCPVKTSCHKSDATNSGVICCPGTEPCQPLNNIQAYCPENTVPCTVELGGGCCPTADQCSPNGCVDYIEGYSPTDHAANATTQTITITTEFPATITLPMPVVSGVSEVLFEDGNAERRSTSTVTEVVGGSVRVEATRAKEGEVSESTGDNGNGPPAPKKSKGERRGGFGSIGWMMAELACVAGGMLWL